MRTELLQADMFGLVLMAMRQGYSSQLTTPTSTSPSSSPPPEEVIIEDDVEGLSQPLRLPLHSPIRRVPNEILSHVFLTSVQAKFDDLHGVRPPDWTSSVWNLSLVCSRWREIAVNMPELWSYVYVHVERFRFSFQRTHKLQTHITRSKQFPLTLFLDIMDLQSMVADLGGYNLIAPLFPRVKTLIYSLYNQTPLFFSKYAGQFPLLTSVDIRDVEDFGDAFLGCPRLRAAGIHGYSWDHWGSIRMPWSQLTSLSASSRTSGSWESFCVVLDALTQATALEELKLMICTDYDITGMSRMRSIRSEQVPKILHLKHLRRLFLTLDDQSQAKWIVALLQSWIFPQLDMLSFDVLANTLLPETVQALARMVKQSKCQISTLCLGMSSNTQFDTLRSLFQAIPTTRTLKLYLYHDYIHVQTTLQTVIQILTLGDSNSEPILPLLNVLKLRDSHEVLQGSGGMGADVVRMLQSRQLPPLDTLCLAYAGDQTSLMNKEEREYVVKQKGEGLIFKVVNDLLVCVSPEIEWVGPFLNY